VGILPPVAPPTEVDEPVEREPRFLPDLTNGLKEGLMEAINKLQEGLDQLRDLVR